MLLNTVTAVLAVNGSSIGTDITGLYFCHFPLSSTLQPPAPQRDAFAALLCLSSPRCGLTAFHAHLPSATTQKYLDDARCGRLRLARAAQRGYRAEADLKRNTKATRAAPRARRASPPKHAALRGVRRLAAAHGGCLLRRSRGYARRRYRRNLMSPARRLSPL